MIIRPDPLAAEPAAASHVQVDFLPPYMRQQTFVLSIRCMPTGPLAGVLPEFDGNLELDSQGLTGCLVSLTGSYRPPPAACGHPMTRQVLQTAAAATCHTLLTRLSTSLTLPNATELPHSAQQTHGLRNPAKLSAGTRSAPFMRTPGVPKD